jgi:two-component system CheB/CheR fusion protein
MNDQDFHHPDFEELLDFLRSSRGFDFSGYKRSSLIRRVNKCRHALALSNYGEYID